MRIVKKCFIPNTKRIFKNRYLDQYGAGKNSPKPFLDITLQRMGRCDEISNNCNYVGLQNFWKSNDKTKKGSIINISSASAGPPLSKAFAYSVAKAGIKNLTMNLAREWATENIRVNAIRPGFFPN